MSMKGEHISNRSHSVLFTFGFLSVNQTSFQATFHSVICKSSLSWNYILLCKCSCVNLAIIMLGCCGCQGVFSVFFSMLPCR